MEDFYRLCEHKYKTFKASEKNLYTQEMLREVCLGIHSMCVGAESRYFNGHTNIQDSTFLTFGVKGLMDTNKRLKDALLFNILSYMSNQLIGVGNCVASIDELYLFLTNQTAIPGLIVHATGHVGVYIGNGYVIEAMGTRYGVVKTRVASRNWTGWCKNPYINYVEEGEELS